MFLVVRSLVYHWRIQLAVSLSVAVATAVLTGALLVGDSVRGSLRELTLGRLGQIDEVLIQDHFFRLRMVEALNADPRFTAACHPAVGAALFPHATVEHRQAARTQRASSVLVLGSGESFWSLDTRGIRPRQIPGDDQIVLNQTLADDLGVRIGDEVTLRLPQSNQVPADSPLASKNDRVQGIPGLKVVDIIPAEGLGRFSLQASQGLPRNAFVSLATLQEALEQPDRANAVFVSRRADAEEPVEELSSLLQPTVADFGVTVKHVQLTVTGSNAAPIADYYTVTTDRMVFSPEMGPVIAKALEPLKGQPVLTYLANSIARRPREPAESDSTDASKDASENASKDATVDHRESVPYSMVTAIDLSAAFPLTDAAGQSISALADDELLMNSWTAQELGAQPGDRIRLQYYAPETTHGQPVKRSAEFSLKAITPLTVPARPYRRGGRVAEYDQPPTLANDPDLTPEVKGVTDQETIDDWDAPFPFDYQLVKTADEDYWENYRTTPKVFVSLAAGQRLWGSRFGSVTSYRVPAATDETDLTTRLEAALRAASDELGFRFQPIKQQQLAASKGTTPFDALFLALSFFVIAAALMLVALLFRLGVEQRAVEMGILLAAGMRRRRVARLLVLEGSLVSAAGAGLGVVIGIGYCLLMIVGLSRWWVGAITTPFLQFHWTTRSLILGYLLGVIISAMTITWTVWQTRRVSVRRLLGGWIEEPPPVSAGGWQWLPGLFFVLALALIVTAAFLGGMAQAGAFVGGGATLLAGLLLAIRTRLRSSASPNSEQWTHGWVLLRLAVRSAARNPSRSVITIGLMAFATFLIVSMSSFRLAPTDSGTGGFQLVAESSEPVYVDLNAPERRDEYFGTQAKLLDGTTILGMRLRAGDDASCNNLYKAAQPRVIGVTEQFAAHFDRPEAISFPWSGSAAATDQERANPWLVLHPSSTTDSGPIPVVIDKNTAMYGLGLYRGVGEEFTFSYDDQEFSFRVAGLLENSLLQGSLLMGEADFQKCFPAVSGYRYFLMATPPSATDEVARLCEDRLGDQGFDAVSTQRVLEQLLSVQNTYLSTFQSLGALGLLLGTFGLAAVQMRNVLERRGELGLMRATGYRRGRLARMVLLESFALLIGGLLTGTLAALVSVLPHKFLGEAAFSWQLLRDLGVMLAVILLAGLVSSLASARSVLRLPLLASLRGE